MKLPNFFIVGAPKCGTTALYTYLNRHPDIFLPEEKEPHFFNTDVEAPHFVRDRDRYLALFQAVRNETRIGEASVWYLYSKNAAREIKAFCPEAKIVMMLRNPVEMVHSYHSQRLAWGNEDIFDFREALAAEADRRAGRRLPQTNPYPVEGLFYSEIALYAEQVQRYLDAFARENVKIIIFDDFKRDTSSVFRETLEFLEVDPSFQTQMDVVNPNRKRRSRRFHDFLHHAPASVIALGKLLVPPSKRRAVWVSLEHMNTSWEPRPPMPLDLRLVLQEHFATDVRRLDSLIGRDLYALWFDDPSPPPGRVTN